MISFTQECFVSSLIEKRFSNFVDAFLILHYYLPLETDVALRLNKKNIIYITNGCFMQIWLDIGQVVLEQKMKM